MSTDMKNVLSSGDHSAGNAKNPLRSILPALAGILFGAEPLGHLDGGFITFPDSVATGMGATQWKLDQLNSGAGSLVLQPAAAGVAPFLRLTADGTAHHGAQVRGPIAASGSIVGQFIPDTHRPIWAKWRFKFTGTDSAGVMGMITASTTAALSNVDAVNAVDGIFFSFVGSTGVITAHVRAASTSSTFAMSQVLASGTWYEAGFYVDDTLDCVSFYCWPVASARPAPQQQLTMTNLPTVALIPAVALTSPAGAGATLDFYKQFWAQQSI